MNMNEMEYIEKATQAAKGFIMQLCIIADEAKLNRNGFILANAEALLKEALIKDFSKF